MNQLLKYPGDKWWKYVALWNDPSLRSFLPETMVYDRDNLERMWSKYPVLFLKPALGTGGKGIVKLSRTEAQTWMTDSGSNKSVINHSRHPHVPTKIWRSFNPRHYIVQQGIDLLKIGGRPTDFRILLLKSGPSWNVMGMMGKIAAKRKFVTNFCQGGDAVMCKEALERSGLFGRWRAGMIEDLLYDVALQAANVLNDYFPNLHEIGIDAAVDSEGGIFILEANTKPHYNLFRHHDNRNLFAHIDRIIRKLRRMPAKTRSTRNVVKLRPIAPADSAEPMIPFLSDLQELFSKHTPPLVHLNHKLDASEHSTQSITDKGDVEFLTESPTESSRVLR